MSLQKPIFLVLWKQSSKNYSHFNTFTIKNEKNYDLTLVPHPMLIQVVSTIFYQIFIFHQLIALQNWKMFFILSKKLFLFLRYLIFCIFVLPLFFPVSHCFRDWSKKNLKIHDFINCLNKKLIANFVWYLEKEIRCDHQRYK